MDKRQEIEIRIEKNEEVIKDIKEMMYKDNAPKGYSKGTSYLDADCIHGTMFKLDLAGAAQRLRELEHLIYLDKLILDNYIKEDRVNKTLKELTNTKDKVYYLRQVEGYTQEKTGEILGITDRWVRKLEK